MDDWVTFALERYNYWVFILLMMIGLYTVFARGNLVKKIVGLNIFQTSVFIYYISIGKIAGGTAPIFMDGELERAAAISGHGGGHGEEHGEALHAAPDAHGANELPEAGAALHAEPDAMASKLGNNFPDNDMKAALEAAPPASDAGADALHAAPDGVIGDMSKITNNALSHADKVAPAPHFDVAGDAAASLHAGDHANNLVETFSGGYPSVIEVVYTNPLPHVLILTAIVVGVATTAVGLALAVRIREAYGTIEEDELDAADDIAEFGHIPGSTAEGPAI
ncbi:MAG: cation:proton antiporter subunit C [Parvularculaceae bacterium]